MTRMGAVQIILFRVFLSGYLLYYFVMMFPQAHTLLGAHGLFKGTKLFTGFPNLFSYAENPSHAGLMVGALGVCCVLMAVGWERRVMALLVWYGWACVMGQSTAIHLPTEFYIGAFLWMFVLIPKGEGMPTTMHKLAWLITGALYSYVGYQKLGSAEWLSGTGFQKAVIALELSFLLLSLNLWTRAFGWTAMVAVQLLALSGAVGGGAPVEGFIGILLVFTFLFEVRWLERIAPYFRPKSRIPEVYR